MSLDTPYYHLDLKFVSYTSLVTIISLYVESSFTFLRFTHTILALTDHAHELAAKVNDIDDKMSYRLTISKKEKNVILCYIGVQLSNSIENCYFNYRREVFNKLNTE